MLLYHAVTMEITLCVYDLKKRENRKQKTDNQLPCMSHNSGCRVKQRKNGYHRYLSIPPSPNKVCRKSDPTSPPKKKTRMSEMEPPSPTPQRSSLSDIITVWTSSFLGCTSKFTIGYHHSINIIIPRMYLKHAHRLHR